MKFRVIYIGYVILSIALLLFSYTQVDLNLTLSRSSIVQTIEKAFQYVGFYQRPLSTAMYIGILGLLFTVYYVLLAAIKKNVVIIKDVWKLIFIVVAILIFSYPAAFSYDFFNYMFTAKTVLVYHQNPYVVTPLLFSAIDPWTNFMRWTHLTTAYAPLWIGMTLVPYIIGLGYFVPTLLMMKIMIASFYLLACWAIDKSTKSTYSLAYFALNPLIIIETLVSGHNDIVLVAFAMIAVMEQSWFWLSMSIAAKTMTLALIPVMVLKRNRYWMLVAMLVALGLVLVKREFLPWYWVWIIPFIALISENGTWTRFATIISFGLLVSYAPYLYFGDYGVTEQLWKTGIIWTGVGIGVLSFTVKSGRTQ